MQNKLTIQWKDYIGRNATPCPPPKCEKFKGVKTLEAAKSIIGRRVSDNMLFAVWNGVYLVGNGRKPKKEKIVKAETVIIDKTVKPKQSARNSFFGKVIGKVQKLFSRQKH